MLSRASVILPTALLRTVYISLIRSHLESCSAVWSLAANSHLHKLDIIQKRASRIILNKPRDSHAEPLQKILKLENLETRRHRHIINIVLSCLQNEYNPALNDLFETSLEGNHLIYNKSYRINLGRRRFENFAGELVDKWL